MRIYKTINKINGKIYIGQDKNNRDNYLGSGKYLKRAIKKYGKQNFKKEILQECNTIEELNEAEIYWIKELNSKTPNGYNITDGGNGVGSLRKGCKLTEEHKRKLSLAHTNPSKETREKISIGTKIGMLKIKK